MYPRSSSKVCRCETLVTVQKKSKRSQDKKWLAPVRAVKMAQNTEELQKFPKTAWSFLPPLPVDSKGQPRPQRVRLLSLRNSLWPVLWPHNKTCEPGLRQQPFHTPKSQATDKDQMSVQAASWKGCGGGGGISTFWHAWEFLGLQKLAH